MIKAYFITGLLALLSFFSMQPSPVFTLQLNQTNTIEDLSITLTDIVSEAIAENPLDSENYPAGSGVSVYLALEKNGEIKEMVLSKLSEPYPSKLSEIWEGYRVELREIGEEVDEVSLEVSRS